ncbi:MAG: ProQ/FinO family protein [Gammaproteobacteria bacterium]|nr:ProQ/FinO family protein [Gammaproteobacteria bacterium]
MDIKTKQKNKAKLDRQQALNWLAKTFPEAFDNSKRIRPLKIGIMRDIMSYADEAQLAGVSKTKLREAVVLFTRRIDYLTCLKLRENRIDLTGQIDEQVTQGDADKAILKIKKRIEKACQHTITPSTAPQRGVKQKTAYESKPIATLTAKSHPSITIKRKFTAPLDPEMTRKLREKLDLQETS